MVMATSIDLTDYVLVVVGAGVYLVPVCDPLSIFITSLAFVKNIVAKMNSRRVTITVRPLAGNVFVVATIVTLLPVGAVTLGVTPDAVVDVEFIAASPTGASEHMIKAVALEASEAGVAVGIDIAISLAQPETVAAANYMFGKALEVKVGLVLQCPPSSSSSSEGEFGGGRCFIFLGERNGLGIPAGGAVPPAEHNMCREENRGR